MGTEYRLSRWVEPAWTWGQMIRRRSEPQRPDCWAEARATPGETAGRAGGSVWRAGRKQAPRSGEGDKPSVIGDSEELLRWVQEE